MNFRIGHTSLTQPHKSHIHGANVSKLTFLLLKSQGTVFLPVGATMKNKEGNLQNAQYMSDPMSSGHHSGHLASKIKQDLLSMAFMYHLTFCFFIPIFNFWPRVLIPTLPLTSLGNSEQII